LTTPLAWYASRARRLAPPKPRSASLSGERRGAVESLALSAAGARAFQASGGSAESLALLRQLALAVWPAARARSTLRAILYRRLHRYERRDQGRARDISEAGCISVTARAAPTRPGRLGRVSHVASMMQQPSSN